jgi:hypothetical protein
MKVIKECLRKIQQQAEIQTFRSDFPLSLQGKLPHCRIVRDSQHFSIPVCSVSEQIAHQLYRTEENGRCSDAGRAE